ncbi:MAG: hypothetical protein HOC70_15705 [Gammaproteobacteria bacterium]|jgi:hypothetical protein|nr:hypothetical protein [Gammaproteobacteria bacterium]MBT4494688.1 hypothetical protein [Gammaproteobacteria bacterium]MBT7371975.1 hypothetical protein [Gammaproteobacteria bacterium]
MKKVILPFLALILLSGPVGAEEGMLKHQSIDDLLVGIVTAHPDSRQRALNNALTMIRGETDLFVQTSLETGYSHEDVINQCPMNLDGSQLISLMTVLTEDSVDLEKMFTGCLPHVPAEHMANLIASVLQVSDPTEINSTIQLAMSILGQEGLDSSTIMVESLISGGLVQADDTNCVGDCLRELAEDFIDNLDEGFGFETGVAQADEPALSDS